VGSVRPAKRWGYSQRERDGLTGDRCSEYFTPSLGHDETVVRCCQAAVADKVDCLMCLQLCQRESPQHLNLSLNDSDHRAAPVSMRKDFMVARNAVESLMGRVVVFCIEKPAGRCSRQEQHSRRACGPPRRQRRTSALKSEFVLAFCVRKPYNRLDRRLGFANYPLREPRASAGSRSDGNVRALRIGRGHRTLT